MWACSVKLVVNSEISIFSTLTDTPVWDLMEKLSRAEYFVLIIIPSFKHIRMWYHFACVSIGWDSDRRDGESMMWSLGRNL